MATWLREHPGAEYVCRDGSATYAEAIRQALPEAVQVSDRWHLWSNLCGKILAEVRSHAACWATAVNPARPQGVREQTTRGGGSASTTCSARASPCSNAPAASMSP